MKCNNKEPLGRLICLTAQEIKNFAEKILLPYDLTLEQFHLLKNMSQEQGMTQRDLGEAVNKTPANITRILDRLESKSLVIRRNSPEDRRSSEVLLTDVGQKLLMQVTGILESFSENLTEGIQPEEQQKIKTALDRIALNLEAMSRELKTN